MQPFTHESVGKELWLLSASEQSRLDQAKNTFELDDIHCELCASAEDEEGMLLCDHCDKGY